MREALRTSVGVKAGRLKANEAPVAGLGRGPADRWHRGDIVAAGADCPTVERLPAQQ